MKKYNRLYTTLCLLSVICSSCLFTGCQTPQPPSLPETSLSTAEEAHVSNAEAEIKKAPNESKTTLYISTAYSPGTSVKLNQDAYDLQSSKEIPLSFRFSQEKGEWKSETRTLTLGDTTYTASQARTITYKDVSTQTPTMTPFRALDNYTGAIGTGRVDFSYRQGTNDLVRFNITGNNTEWIQGDLTAEEAKEKADGLLSQLYAKETIDRYTHYSTTYDENTNCYDVHYIRYVYGYKTEDAITVSYDSAGDVKSINALCMGYADVLEAQVNEATLTQAKTSLLKCSEENQTITIGQLMLAADGKCYMSGGMLFETTDFLGQSSTGAMFLYIIVE